LAEQDASQLRALGAAIRDSRRGRLSLEGLAQRAGVSLGQLSQIENGTANPSVETLIRIAGALGLDLSDLVELPPAGHTYVVRAGDRRRYRSPLIAHDVALITPGIRHQLSISYCAMRPGVTSAAEQGLHGVVLYFVVEGQLEARKGTASYRLRAGDSLLLALPHGLANVSDAPADYIAVFRPEEDR
jgi:transcriptional regulator with XRE-family HTH domain